MLQECGCELWWAEPHTHPGSHAARVSCVLLGLSLPQELPGVLLYHFAPLGSPPITSYSSHPSRRFSVDRSLTAISRTPVFAVSCVSHRT